MSALLQFLRPRLQRFEESLKSRFLGPAAARAKEAMDRLEQLLAMNGDWAQAVYHYAVEFHRIKEGLRGVKKEIGNLQNAFLDDRYGLEKMVAARQAQPSGPVDPV